MTLPTNEHGYIALMSVIIISAVLLGITLGSASLGITARVVEQQAREHEESRYHADLCVSVARVLAQNDPSRTIDHPLPIPEHSPYCTIHSLTHTATASIVKVEGLSGHAHTRLLVTFDRSMLDIVSREVVSTF